MNDKTFNELIERVEEKVNDYVKEILDAYDLELHQIYYLIHAYWYGSEDAKDGTVDLSLSYEEWATTWICEVNLGEFEKQMFEVLEHYYDLMFVEAIRLNERYEVK